MKPGTRVEAKGCPAMGGYEAVPPQKGIIIEPTADMLPLPQGEWSIIRFDAGGEVCIHDSALRVVE